MNNIESEEMRLDWKHWKAEYENELNKLSAGLEFDDMIPWVDARHYWYRGSSPKAVADLGWNRLVNDRIPKRESRYDVEGEIDGFYARSIPTWASRAVE